MRAARYRLFTLLGGDRGAGQIREFLRSGDPYRDRWAQFASWADQIDPAPVEDDRKILVSSVLPHWIDVCLVISVVLAQQGHNVVFAWLPYVRNDKPFSLVTALHDRFARLFPSPVQHPRLRVINLLRVPPLPLDSKLLRHVEEQSVVDAAYVTRRGEIDSASFRDRMLVRIRSKRNARAMGSLLRLLKEDSYKSLLTPHGNVMEFGVALRLAQELGVNPVTFEFWDEENSIIAARGEPSVLLNTRDAWEKDAPHTMTPERRSRVEQYMKIREGTDWPGFFLPMQSSPIEDTNAARLGITGKRPVFLMCPGAAWDALHLNLPGYPFGSMLEWVRETLRFFASRSDCDLVVRCHPVESRIATTQRMQDVVREELGRIPDHIRVIASEDPVNTYSLMEMATAGIAYTSTTGLEMLMRGIEVVIGGPAHYGGKGFTHDLGSREEYFEMINSIVRAFPHVDGLSQRRRELALCYLDVLRNWAKPFPWSMDNLKSEVGVLSPTGLMTEEGAARFGATFEFLSGEVKASS